MYATAGLSAPWHLRLLVCLPTNKQHLFSCYVLHVTVCSTTLQYVLPRASPGDIPYYRHRTEKRVARPALRDVEGMTTVTSFDG